MRRPKVSIIIISWNNENDIRELLSALKEVRYENFDVVLVDNASKSGPPKTIPADYSGVTLIESQVNRGWGGGVNLGIKLALEKGADYALLLNADVVVTPDFLDEMVDTAEGEESAGLVAPVIYYNSTRTRIQHCGSVVNWEEATTRSLEDIDEITTIPEQRFWVWGTSLLIKRRVVEEAGYFDERYLCYSEDAEYCVRAFRKGFKSRVAVNGKIYHKCHEIDVGGRKNLPLYFFFYLTRNEYWFFSEYLTGWRRFNSLRRYFARILDEIGHCKEDGRYEAIHAYLDGLYCAFKGYAGEWDKTKKMPAWVSRIVMAMPFVLCDLLRGRFGAVAKSFFSRVVKSKKAAA